MPLSEQAALYGGAFKRCLEALNPYNCTTHERRAAVEAGAAAIREWVSAQPEHVRGAYLGRLESPEADVRKGALRAIVEEADKCLENNLRSRQLQEAYAGMPAPALTAERG